MHQIFQSKPKYLNLFVVRHYNPIYSHFTFIFREGCMCNAYSSPTSNYRKTLALGGASSYLYFSFMKNVFIVVSFGWFPHKFHKLTKHHWMHHRTSSYAYYCLLKTNWVNSFCVSLHVLTLAIVPSYILFITSTCLYEFITFQAPTKRFFLALYHIYHKQRNIIWTYI